MPRRTKEDLTLRSQRRIAEFFSVSVSTVASWRKEGMPGEKGRWSVRDIIRWLVARRAIPVMADAAGSNNGNGDPLLAGQASPALEQYRRARAAIAEMQQKQMSNELVSVRSMRDCHAIMARNLRQLGERLERLYGADAADLLTETLDRCREASDQYFLQHTGQQNDQP